ncbi:class II aldolase/adducin family protein [Paraburkholderia susongensis]|uniref:Ribulose-5-phosphate 4-epimerase/Fuculose-1-phosphate aldolase n=1 Tax=Paraburkholderia susongensis TaxID=1515439 RepID=A0A1X7LI72_9BURK|nr:class II aldolase/adducin family protein [Paraburkholderia susongensis]SMG52962.1 Ribulose-5-phosphate 4-epimerase/Fuculose-1-phosphate aldolase [Paraburkholderia susongensis]
MSCIHHERCGQAGEYTDEVWRRRVELAAAYRLTALFKWDDLVATHISARVPGTTDQFLINPYGLLFEEVTASSLITVDIDGRKLDESPYEVNPAGFTIHSAIHAARHDAECVMHTHTLNGTAVSAQVEGVLPLSQQSMLVLQSLGYHDYEGIALRDDEKPRLVQSLGSNDFLMLRNHGLLTVGRSVGEAFIFMYLFEAVCSIQVRALAGARPLNHIDSSIIATAREQVKAATQGQGAAMAWPSLLRRLDRQLPGYDT